jgi:hypothetical protein
LNDVALVKKEAKIVLDISKGVGNAELSENADGRLNVLAIIGPGVGLPESPIAGQAFDEALLCEIGISRSRPYARNFLGKDGSKPYSVGKRRKWFGLTDEQYLELGPVIFHYLQTLADMRIAEWKHPTYRIKSSRTYWYRRTSSLDQKDFKTLVDRGARFTVSTADSKILADVYRAEFDNRKIQRQMGGLSRQIDLLLHPYRRGFKKRFGKLAVARRVREVFQDSSLSRYLKLEALTFLPDRTQRQFNVHLQETLGWTGGPTIQRTLADRVLRNHKSRVNGTKLRVKSEKKTYVVFEIFAQNAHKLSSGEL